MTIDAILDDVLRREGGYVDHAADRGGPTNFGITQATLADWRGGPATAQDVQQLTEREARQIYQRLYVDRPGFGAVPDDPLRALLVDYAVHSGPRRAVQDLQRVVGVSVDGVLGPQTLDGIARVGVDFTRRGLLQLRGRFLARILEQQPSQRVFAAGWLRRIMEFV